jgi:hypothetical protein
MEVHWMKCLPEQFFVQVAINDRQRQTLEERVPLGWSYERHSSVVIPDRNDSSGESGTLSVKLEFCNRRVLFSRCFACENRIQRDDYQVYALLPDVRDFESWHN